MQKKYLTIGFFPTMTSNSYGTGIPESVRRSRMSVVERRSLEERHIRDLKILDYVFYTKM